MTRQQVAGQSELLSLWRSLGINLLALQSAHDQLDKGKAGEDTFKRILQAQHAVDELTEFAVKTARSNDKSWAQIGHYLGVTPQAAHKRYRHLDS